MGSLTVAGGASYQLAMRIEAKKHLPTILIIFFLVVVTGGVFSILKYGYVPAPVVVMKPSFFSKPEDIGAVIYRRFFSPIEERKRVFIGIPPQPAWYRSVILGFVQTAADEQHPFDVVIVEEQMPQIDFSKFTTLNVMNLATNMDSISQLTGLLDQFARDGKRVLVYLPSIFTSHVLAGNLINRIEAALQTHELTISVMPLALAPDQEYLIDPQCLGSERDTNSTAPIGCVALEGGRHNYRKKVPQDRWVAIMNAPKPDDYLLQISTPGQDKNNDKANRQFRMAAPPAAH
jgi:hypothetical protein